MSSASLNSIATLPTQPAKAAFSATALASSPTPAQPAPFPSEDQLVPNAPPTRFGTPIIAAFRPAPRRIYDADSESQPDPLEQLIARPRPQQPTLPDPLSWAAVFARAAVEVLQGYRASAQLSRWMTIPLFDALERRARLNAALNNATSVMAARVLGMHLQTPVAGVFEATITVAHCERIYCAALAFRECRAKWQVIELEIG